MTQTVLRRLIETSMTSSTQTQTTSMEIPPKPSGNEPTETEFVSDAGREQSKEEREKESDSADGKVSDMERKAAELSHAQEKNAALGIFLTRGGVELIAIFSAARVIEAVQKVLTEDEDTDEAMLDIVMALQSEPEKRVAALHQMLAAIDAAEKSFVDDPKEGEKDSKNAGQFRQRRESVQHMIQKDEECRMLEEKGKKSPENQSVELGWGKTEMAGLGQTSEDFKALSKRIEDADGDVEKAYKNQEVSIDGLQQSLVVEKAKLLGDLEQAKAEIVQEIQAQGREQYAKHVGDLETLRDTAMKTDVGEQIIQSGHQAFEESTKDLQTWVDEQASLKTSGLSAAIERLTNIRI
jgi:hypothetical protein